MTTPTDRRSKQETEALLAWLRDDHQGLQRRARSTGAAQTEDQGTGAVSGTDASSLPELGPLAPLESWASVAATMLYKAQTLAGWDPVSTAFDEAAWALYLSKLSTLPFFLVTDSSSRDISISPTSLQGIVDAVVIRTQGIATPEVCAEVVTSVKKIATVIVETEGGANKRSLTTQGVISIFRDRLYASCLYTTVPMVYNAEKPGYDPEKAQISFRTFTGTFDLDKCKRYADTLLGWTPESDAQWAQRTSSADQVPNESPAWNK